MFQDTTACVRLYDVTVNAPVSGSEGYKTNTAGVTYRFRTPAFALPRTLHEYVVQGRSSNPVASTDSASLIIDW